MTSQNTYPLPMGFKVTMTASTVGSISFTWKPHKPELTSPKVRKKVRPAYEAAMQSFVAEAYPGLSNALASKPCKIASRDWAGSRASVAR